MFSTIRMLIIFLHKIKFFSRSPLLFILYSNVCPNPITKVWKTGNSTVYIYSVALLQRFRDAGCNIKEAKFHNNVINNAIRNIPIDQVFTIHSNTVNQYCYKKKLLRKLYWKFKIINFWNNSPVLKWEISFLFIDSNTISPYKFGNIFEIF